MHHFDVNFSKFWKKNSLCVHIVKRISFFSYKVSVLKTCIDYLKMHSECTILMQISQKIPSPTLPVSALRASVKPSASLATCAPPPPPPGSGGSGSAPVKLLLPRLNYFKVKYLILTGGYIQNHIQIYIPVYISIIQQHFYFKKCRTSTSLKQVERNIDIKSTETTNDTGWGTTCSLRRWIGHCKKSSKL